MRNNARIALLFIFALLAAAGLSAAMFGSPANAIDNVHWSGDPLPPCFLDASHCGGHLLGLDLNGRDVAARLAVGARNTYLAALCNVVVAVVLGAALGLLGRLSKLRNFAALVAEGLAALPAWPFLAIVCIVELSRGSHTAEIPPARWFLLGILLYAPIARSIGRRDTFPIVFGEAAGVWFEAMLWLSVVDFLGFGVQPPTASLGNMLVDSPTALETAWWATVFPALALMLMLLLLQVVRSRPSIPDPAVPSAGRN